MSLDSRNIVPTRNFAPFLVWGPASQVHAITRDEVPKSLEVYGLNWIYIFHADNLWQPKSPVIEISSEPSSEVPRAFSKNIGWKVIWFYNGPWAETEINYLALQLPPVGVVDDILDAADEISREKWNIVATLRSRLGLTALWQYTADVDDYERSLDWEWIQDYLWITDERGLRCLWTCDNQFDGPWKDVDAGISDANPEAFYVVRPYLGNKHKS